jgi:hypothetical protein
MVRSAFFDVTSGLPNAACHEDYVIVRDSTWAPSAEARARMEEWWHHAGAYLDADLPARAQREFPQRVWELYVTHVLLENGVALVPKKDRPHQRIGPDLLLAKAGGGVRTWLEIVLALPGDGPDAVPDVTPARPGEPVVASHVPDDQIKLRLRNALANKAERSTKYRTAGVIGLHDRYVVALGGAAIPYARHEATLPRIVRSVLPFGAEQFHLDSHSLEVTGRSFAYQECVTKRSGESVSTAYFLSAESTGISGVLYSVADALNCPEQPGADFVMVHNPTATAPLAPGAFPFGIEYVVVGDHLTATCHSARRTESL